MRTLVVDDDATCRMLLEKVLSKYGEAVSVDGGAAALERLREGLMTGKRFDLVCLDIMMPGLDGQEVLRKIRKQEEERGVLGNDGVKVIMTTALSDRSNVFQAFKSQCEAYLVKPIDTAQLKKHLIELGLVKEA